MIKLIKFSSLARESGVAFIFRGIGTAAGLAMNLAISHSLGATQAGSYFLCLAIVTFLSGITRVGLDNTVLRFIGSSKAANDWASVRYVLARSLRAVLVVSTAVALIVFLFSDLISKNVFGKPEIAPTLAAMAPGIVGFSACFVLSFAFQGVRRIPLSVFAQSLGVALLVCVSSIFLTSATIAAAAYSLSTILVLVVGLFVWNRMLPATRESPSVSDSDLRASAFPLWITTVTAGLQLWAGQFVAGAYLQSDQLAQLAVAQRTAFFISFFLMASSLVVAPKFSALYKQGKLDELAQLARSSIKLVIIFTVPVVLVLFVWAEEAMSMFGKDFSAGANLLRVLIVGQLINAITGPVGYLLIMSGNERDMRNISLVCGPLAVALALAFVPFWGATGAAISTAAAIAAQNIAAAILVKRRLGFSLF